MSGFDPRVPSEIRERLAELGVERGEVASAIAAVLRALVGIDLINRAAALSVVLQSTRIVSETTDVALGARFREVEALIASTDYLVRKLAQSRRETPS